MRQPTKPDHKEITQKRAVKNLLLSCLTVALREAIGIASEKHSARRRREAQKWLSEPIAQEILEMSGVPATYKIADILPKIKSGQFKIPTLTDWY